MRSEAQQDRADRRALREARRVRVHDILNITHPHDPVARSFGFFITILIILNVIAVILQTVEALQSRYEPMFYYFEMGSVAVFSVEYILRLWSCTVDERYRRPLLGRLRYAVTPLALVDLLAIAPFYPMVFFGVRTVDTTFIRALRLFRLMRLFKTTRYFHSLDIMARVVRAKAEQIVISLIVVAILLVLLSSAIFFVEHDAHHSGSEFTSIPVAMWWGVSALTTVGYGDIVPVTPLGKVIGALVSLLGVGLFAMPAGILASGFTEELRNRHGEHKRCPHCGKEVD